MFEISQSNQLPYGVHGIYGGTPGFWEFLELQKALFRENSKGSITQKGKEPLIPTSRPSRIRLDENLLMLRQPGPDPHLTRYPGSSGSYGKGPTCQYRRHKNWGFDPLVRKIPWRRAQQPTPVFLPGESQGRLQSIGSQRVGHNWSDLATHALDPNLGL